MLNQKQLEVLQQDKSLIQLRVNEGVNLFVDQSDKWEREFDLDQNRLLIKFNQPHEHLTTEVVYKDFFIMDRRESILDLKLKIASSLVRPLQELVFRRGGTHGSELVDDEQSLKQGQFYNMICVYVQVGVPS